MPSDPVTDAPPSAPSRAPLRPSLRFTLGRDIAIGPGKAQLLELIRDTGSIASAGRSMGMSYKRAWTLVATMNRCFREPLVMVSRGGSEHGGATVTDLGLAILDAYRQLTVLIAASDATAVLRAAITGEIAELR